MFGAGAGAGAELRTEPRGEGQGRLAWAGWADHLSEPCQRWKSLKEE